MSNVEYILCMSLAFIAGVPTGFLILGYIFLKAGNIKINNDTK